MSENQATVFVIDDDVSVRESIEEMVKSIGLRAQTFASTTAFLQTPLRDGPNCLVLDVRLPGASGIDFQHELTKADIRIPIIFITGYGDIPMSVRAMKAGAVEFLTKPFRDQDLIDAIQHGLEKDRMMREQRLELAELRRRFETLTNREARVMAMVVTGKLNREIAAQLGTSEITVKVQRSHVMRKMLAETVIDLVRMAEKLDIRAAK
jgi:FixJ family two-component response regulator